MLLPHEPALDKLYPIADRLLDHDADIAPRTAIDARWSAGQYLKFAARHGLPGSIEALDPVDLAAFAYEQLFLARLKPTSVRTYLYGISRIWQAATGRSSSIDVTARQVLRTASEQLPQRARRPAVVVPLWLALEMGQQMAPGLPGYQVTGRGRKLGHWRAARDQALLGALFGGALRPAEALESSIHHLTRRENGWELALTSSKTNQYGDRREYVFLADDDLLASGRCMTAWMQIRGELTGDALFPGEPDGLPLSQGSASVRIRAAATRSGHTDNAISLYSFRRTWATLALLQGAAFETISKRLRHASLSTTSRYIDSLSHLLDDADVKALYLARERPEGADPNHLGRGPAKPKGTIRSRLDTSDAAPISLDELRDLAVEAAQRGRFPYAESTTIEMARITGKWAEFCAIHRIDAADPSPEHVAAWTVAMRRSSKAAGGGSITGKTLQKYVHLLDHAFVVVDPTVVPPTWKALKVADAYRREDADDDMREVIQAPVHSRATFLEIAAQLSDPVGSIGDLDRIILRRHATQHEGVLLRGHLHRDEVSLYRARVVIRRPDGTILRLERHAELLRCPVRAMERLCATVSAPGQVLMSRWAVNPGRLRSHEMHARIEEWNDAEFELAVWLYGTPIRKMRRLRLLVAMAWAGALRMADVREAQIEELDPFADGYLLHLGRSKSNRNNDIEVIRLVRTGDALCPVAAIDAWLEVWPAKSGPLLAHRIDHHSLHADGTQAGAGKDTTACAVRAISRISGQAMTGHSFRRSRATHDWHDHYDLHRIRRLLRHDDLRWTQRYIEDLDPMATDITAGLASNPTIPAPRVQVQG